jgi:hypothetical protein
MTSKPGDVGSLLDSGTQKMKDGPEPIPLRQFLADAAIAASRYDAVIADY